MPPDSILTQFALAAAAVFFTVQLIKGILPLVLRHRNTNGVGAGNQSVEFWRSAQREIVRDALAVSVVPILERQTSILADLRTLAAQETEVHLRLQMTADQVLEGQGKARESLHKLTERVQGITGRLPPIS